MNIYLSLIVPCYNEAEHLEKSFPKVIEVLRKLKRSFEVIIIDDFSRDNTVDIIRRLIRENKGISIRFIDHNRNIGRGGTVMEGIMIAKGEIVGFIDIDLEVSPEYIPQFVEEIYSKNADIVVGRRTFAFRATNFLRHFASKWYALLVRNFLKLPIGDTEAGYKFFNRKKIIPILGDVKDTRWFWDTEIIARGYMNNLRIIEIEVVFEKRDDKTSTVNIARDTINYIKALVSFKYNISRTQK